MDPIGALHYAKDSTLAMLLAAQARGFELVYFEQGDLALRDGEAFGRGRPLTVRADPNGWFSLGDPELRVTAQVYQSPITPFAGTALGAPKDRPRSMEAATTPGDGLREPPGSWPGPIGR